MLLIELLIVGLAAAYLITAWRYGSLFSETIIKLEHGLLAQWVTLKWGERFKEVGNKLNDLLLCPMCLSPYVSVLCWTLFYLGGAWIVMAFASAAVCYLVVKILSAIK